MSINITVDAVAVLGDNLILRVTTPASLLHGGDPTPGPEIIIVPTAALDSRMRAYSLASPLAALQAIMREHVKRLNKLPDGDEEAPGALHPIARIQAMGGLRADVDVTMPVAIRTALLAEGVE